MGDAYFSDSADDSNCNSLPSLDWERSRCSGSMSHPAGVTEEEVQKAASPTDDIALRTVDLRKLRSEEVPPVDQSILQPADGRSERSEDPSIDLDQVPVRRVVQRITASDIFNVDSLSDASLCTEDFADRDE